MNTEQLYHAQLNALENISVNSILNLIDKLNIIGDASYNYTSRCIEIEKKEASSINDDNKIREILKNWLSDEKNINANDKSVLIDNIDFLFNIAKLGYPDINKHIIQVYLY